MRLGRLTDCREGRCTACSRLADGRPVQAVVEYHLSPAEEAFFSRELTYVRPGLMELSYPDVGSMTMVPYTTPGDE